MGDEQQPKWAKVYRWCGFDEPHPPHAYPEIQDLPQGNKRIVMWPCRGERES